MYRRSSRTVCYRVADIVTAKGSGDDEGTHLHILHGTMQQRMELGCKLIKANKAMRMLSSKTIEIHDICNRIGDNRENIQGIIMTAARTCDAQRRSSAREHHCIALTQHVRRDHGIAQTRHALYALYALCNAPIHSPGTRLFRSTLADDTIRCVSFLSRLKGLSL